MKPAAFVVDTNVLVAGLLARDAASPVARVLDGMLAAAFPFAMSEALLAEYRAVLARPPIRARHGLDDEGIDLLLTELVRHAIVLEPGRGGAGPPPPAPRGGGVRAPPGGPGRGAGEPGPRA
ncbi:MAG: PIN domain-containing protein, partial [Novosphingobium sp.]|nr:PIN domain-containing protein [Novosphingobium sp.]